MLLRAALRSKICSSIFSSSVSSASTHGKVAVDDVVHQRVEHEARAVLQELGLALGARAHGGEADLRAVAHREHVVGADEDVDLAGDELLVAVGDLARARRCAARRTASRRTPRSSAAGGRGARPRRRARAGRTPPPSRRAPRVDGSNSATQTKQSGWLTYSLMSSIGISASLRAVLVGDAADEHVGNATARSWTAS